jgi:predicted RNA-binding protein with TRAM domain
MINKPGKAGYDMGYSRRQGGSYEGRRSHGKGFKRCPVELGEELEVDIKELSPKNEGIAKIQGYVVHVPDAKPGDRVKIKITQVGEKSANAVKIQ